MKRFLTPAGVAVITSLAIVIIVGGVYTLTYVFDCSLFWRYTFSIIAIFLTVFLVNELLFYRRLKILYYKLSIILKRRTQKEPEYNPDPVEGLAQSIVQLSGSISKEFRVMRELDLFRKEYVAVVSHELKTPIFAIEGFLETLLDGALEDENVNRMFIEKALRNVQRLNDIVQDLIIITRLESGELEMRKEPFRIYDLILDVLELLAPMCHMQARSTLLQVKSNNLESQYVYADQERIRQVLINLISNAIYYGKPDGTVTVEMVNNADKMYIKVIDNGFGIEAEHLPHLFDRFYRVEKSRSREKGGTGLGLAIVKNLLDAHDEEITVSSVVGQGTVFTFSLTKKKSRRKMISFALYSSIHSCNKPYKRGDASLTFPM